jgi:HK97 family phage prohead protease
VDNGGDLIEPGAYRKTLAERGGRLRWLWQHDAGQPPIARIVEIREAGRDELPGEVLSQFPEAQGGLLVKREYLDTPRGNEVLAGLLAGAIGEMSIGYDTIQAEYPQAMAVGGRPVRRVLKEMRLWECSDVLWGMNAATANVKALDLDELTTEELVDRLNEAGRLAALVQLLRQLDDEAAARAAEEVRGRQAAYEAMIRRVALAQRTLATV